MLKRFARPKRCLWFAVVFISLFIINHFLTGFHEDYKYSNQLPPGILIRENHTLQDSGTLSFSNNHIKMKWHELPDRFDRINENQIYSKFNIKKPVKREQIDIILIVSTAPTRKDRRMAIRETWWSECISSDRVSIKCVFLTDEKNITTEEGKELINESYHHKDLYFQSLKGGHDFGKRFLYHLVWAKQNFDFAYFLRIDDDYFFCIDRFLQEVPMPPRLHYHWGWIHCDKNLVRPDESIVLLSRDIVESFLGQDIDKMLCHRWAGQMIGVWKHELNLPTYYNHDTRLYHGKPLKNAKLFKTFQNVCTRYIGVHGAYPIQMRKLWKNRGSSNYNANRKFDTYTHRCALPNTMNWTLFPKLWLAEPRLCKTDPFWGGISGRTYIGRQGS